MLYSVGTTSKRKSRAKARLSALLSGLCRPIHHRGHSEDFFACKILIYHNFFYVCQSRNRCASLLFGQLSNTLNHLKPLDASSQAFCDCAKSCAKPAPPDCAKTPLQLVGDIQQIVEYTSLVVLQLFYIHTDAGTARQGKESDQH